jgi:hypothetical protein
LEPGLLFNEQVSDRLCLAGELRYWIPINGTDFAGSIVRYGLGVSYSVFETCNVTVSPVAEFVGWTVLSGASNALQPTGPDVVANLAPMDAAGNAKLGVRVKLGCSSDFYTGYGRALTGDTWYDDIYRLEFRIFY